MLIEEKNIAEGRDWSTSWNIDYMIEKEKLVIYVKLIKDALWEICNFLVQSYL